MHNFDNFFYLEIKLKIKNQYFYLFINERKKNAEEKE